MMIVIDLMGDDEEENSSITSTTKDEEERLAYEKLKQEWMKEQVRRQPVPQVVPVT